MNQRGTKLTGHQVNPANDKLEVLVLDEPGNGGANHVYVVTGHHNPNLISILSEARRDGLIPQSDQALLIPFQDGPIAEVGINGLTHEALITILIDRLTAFQSGPYANKYNADALKHLTAAQERLQARTKDRMAQGVEGTHAVGAESKADSPSDQIASLQSYLSGYHASGVIDHDIRVTHVQRDGSPVFYIHPRGVDGETLDLFTRGSHVALAVTAGHTLIDDFEHMLAYTGLGAESGEIQAKLLHAFAEGRGESIPEGELARLFPAPTALRNGMSVWLKSGSVEMTVAHVERLPNGETRVACTWEGDERLESANYDSRQLSINPVAHDAVQLPPVVVAAPVQSIEINQVIKRDGEVQHLSAAAAPVEDIDPAHGDSQ